VSRSSDETSRVQILSDGENRDLSQSDLTSGDFKRLHFQGTFAERLPYCFPIGEVAGSMGKP
jgi:hypothetical protein